MIRIKDGKNEFVVIWRHKHPAKPNKSTSRTTSCRIFHGPEGERLDDRHQIAEGTSLCSKKDGFERRVGRLVSFKRAMEEVISPKPVRGLLYTKVLPTCGIVVKTRKPKVKKKPATLVPQAPAISQ